MNHVFFLAWRYLVYHKVKTVILMASITLVGFLPIGIEAIVRQTAHQLTLRAQATPLLLGQKGSPLELTLNSLYFDSGSPESMRSREISRVADSGLALAIPLHTRFRIRDHTIVGTTLDYFALRGLELTSGRWMGLLGECVLGASAARSLDAHPGDTLISSPRSVFDFTGAYPLKMHVVGVLRPAGTPDDDAVFLDVRASWVMEGLIHGHQDLGDPRAAAGVLLRDERTIVANASVVEYGEITRENVVTFHSHGDEGEFPVTGAIVVPHDARSGTLLRGRYLGPDEIVQIVDPAEVMDELLATILEVRRYVVAGMALLGFSTLLVTALVFLLSLRSRRRERSTLFRIGGDRGRVAAILASEIVGVFLLSGTLVLMLTAIVNRYGADAIRTFFLR
jgi:putative ABC transport system permease protein